jgi:hypothetical protein
MTATRTMLEATPSETGYDTEALATCIDACFACAQACVACADACLAEEMVGELRRCITMDANCADICEATGRVMSRQTMYEGAISKTLLEACRFACQRCAEECERHATHHEHCRVCAEACRACETACAELVGAGPR